MPLLADFTVDDIAGRPKCHPDIEWTHSALSSRRGENFAARIIEGFNREVHVVLRVRR